MLNACLFDWLNATFVPLFGHLPLNRGKVIAEDTPSFKHPLQDPLPCISNHWAIKAPPQQGRFFTDWIATRQGCNRKRSLFRIWDIQTSN